MLNFFSGNSSGEMAWVICRVLSRVQGLSLDELRDRLQPGPFVERNDTAAPALVLKDSLKLCQSLGLLEVSGKKGSERVGLLIDSSDVIEASQFRTVLRRRILGELTHDGTEKNDGDLFKSCTWLFASDIQRPFDKWDGAGGTEDRITSRHLRPIAISNSTQWNAFARWSIFLGVADHGVGSKGSQTLVADPRVALIDEIGRMAKKKLSGQQFQDLLATNLPMVKNAWVSESLESWDIAPESHIDHDVAFGPVVGHALNLLKRQEILRTNSFSDTTKQGTRIRMWAAGGHGRVEIDEVVL